MLRPLFSFWSTARPRAPASPMEACRFHQDEDRFLRTSLSPSHYDTLKFPRLCRLLSTIYQEGFVRKAAPLTSMPKTTGSPEVSTVEGPGVDEREVVGVAGIGDEPPHCWIRLDHPRCRSLERWGSTTMRSLAVVVVGQMKNCLSSKNLRR